MFCMSYNLTTYKYDLQQAMSPKVFADTYKAHGDFLVCDAEPVLCGEAALLLGEHGDGDALQGVRGLALTAQASPARDTHLLGV